MTANLRSHFHCVYNMHFHLVLVTKYRKKCLSPEILARMEEICREVSGHWDTDLLEFGGEADHAHLLLALHPAMMPSRFVNNLKTVTSRLIRKEFHDHLSKFYLKPVLWTRAYCLISTGGAPIDIIRQYIENQGHEA